jgi:hypothetical protein
MKCHAGVEFKAGSDCPRCKAKLGEVCWPGINADLLELTKLRTALHRIVSLDEKNVPKYAQQIAREALTSG